MLNAQAMIALQAMIGAFGDEAAAAGVTDQDVACMASHVFAGGRTAGFVQKVDMANDVLARAMREDGVGAICRIVAQMRQDDDGVLDVEFVTRRDAEAWDDCLLASFTAIKSIPHDALRRAADNANRQARAVADSGIQGFWQIVDLPGLDTEPSSEEAGRSGNNQPTDATKTR